MSCFENVSCVSAFYPYAYCREAWGQGFLQELNSIICAHMVCIRFPSTEKADSCIYVDSSTATSFHYHSGRHTNRVPVALYTVL
jgi:hypothetical protein